MTNHGEVGLAEEWHATEYAAGFGARMSEIPHSYEGNLFWCRGWEDADTELLETARHRKALAEGREDHYPDTWGLLLDAGSDARSNGIPFDAERTGPWKQGWIEMDIHLGTRYRSE